MPTGRDLPSQRCHTNSGYMWRRIDEPSSKQPKEQEVPCVMCRTNTGARVRIPPSNYPLLSPPEQVALNVNQHFLLVDPLWTTRTCRQVWIPRLKSPLSREQRSAGLVWFYILVQKTTSTYQRSWMDLFTVSQTFQASLCAKTLQFLYCYRRFFCVFVWFYPITYSISSMLMLCLLSK